MKTLIIDCLFIYKDLEKNFDNKNSIEIIFENAKKNQFDRYILLQNGKITKIPEGIKNIIVENFSCENILSIILKEAKNSEDVVVFDGGSPLYDFKFIENMFERHNKFLADYTYGVGYPEGLVPTIIKKDILNEFIRLVKDEDIIKKDYLFYALSKDINSFDIETFLSSYDTRILRVKFGANDAGEEILTKKIYDIFKDNINVDKIVEYIFHNQDKLFTTIYSARFEITNKTNINSIYYPRINYEKNELDFDLFKEIINQLLTINKNIWIILGNIFEPMIHSKFIEILYFLNDNAINYIIETTGEKIDEEFILKLKDLDKRKIHWVIKLDCYEEKTYYIIHPDGDFDKIKKSIKLLKDNNFQTYKQIIRMQENEIEIEKYIRNKEADDIIIRKFSTYCNMIQDKKVVDLSPLERFPCYNLRRTITINPNGEVLFCQFALNNVLGDLTKESIKDIMNKIETEYIKNANKNYQECCKNCDDYYLFTF